MLILLRINCLLGRRVILDEPIHDAIEEGGECLSPLRRLSDLVDAAAASSARTCAILFRCAGLISFPSGYISLLEFASIQAHSTRDVLIKVIYV